MPKEMLDCANFGLGFHKHGSKRPPELVQAEVRADGMVAAGFAVHLIADVVLTTNLAIQSILAHAHPAVQPGTQSQLF